MASLAISFLWLLFFVALVGAAIWGIRTYIPMDGAFKRVFEALVVVAAIVLVILIVYWLLVWLTSMIGGGGGVAFPRLRSP